MSEHASFEFENVGKSDGTVIIDGQKVKPPSGKALVVEDKDWKLIKAQMNTSIVSKGRKPDLFWGGLGLAVGVIGPILEMFVRPAISVWPDLVYVILFAIGIVCVMDATATYIKTKKDNELRKDEFTEFLDDIERRNIRIDQTNVKRPDKP